VIAEPVPVVSGAPADARTRAAWLDRLFEAHAADQIPIRTSQPPSSWRISFVTRPVRRATRDRVAKTLTRAARDFARTNPAFAVEAGLAALRWLVRGYGYEVTSVDVRAAYSHILTAAARAGVDGAVRTRIRTLFDDPATRSGFVASVIGKEVGLD
jgi:hypothetical protein